MNRAGPNQEHIAAWSRYFTEVFSGILIFAVVRDRVSAWRHEEPGAHMAHARLVRLRLVAHARSWWRAMAGTAAAIGRS